MAIAQFNMIHVAKLIILKHCDIEPSYNCVPCFKKLDARRIRVAERQHLEILPKGKIVKNNEKKRELEEPFVGEEGKENASYASGKY
ncbi:hypothetical protein TNCV_3354821 [Trichonephila clavipes]|nr:hypothetical protein TNCV_3354821 [Trichonephila clavipes]